MKFSLWAISLFLCLHSTVLAGNCPQNKSLKALTQTHENIRVVFNSEIIIPKNLAGKVLLVEEDNEVYFYPGEAKLTGVRVTIREHNHELERKINFGRSVFIEIFDSSSNFLFIDREKSPEFSKYITSFQFVNEGYIHKIDSEITTGRMIELRSNRMLVLKCDKKAEKIEI